MRSKVRHDIDKTEWHPWFVWYPLRVYHNGNMQWIWLEWLERKRNHHIDGQSYWNIRPWVNDLGR